MTFFNKQPPPLAIGGVGGSGTRVVATVLSQLGYFMGSDLNEPMDNLLFTLLFKRAELWPPEEHQAEINKACDIFLKASLTQKAWRKSETAYLRSLCQKNRPLHSREWLEARVERLLDRTNRDYQHGKWGWKEPNTHILLPALLKAWPQMRYIHVVRHGLDMAYSSNQNQLQLWGRQLLGTQVISIDAGTSFQYWCAAHRRIAQIGKTMDSRFLMLNFDKLCQQPEKELEVLFNFLEIETGPEVKKHLASLVHQPTSLGRYRNQALSDIKPSDLSFLEEMGYRRPL